MTKPDIEYELHDSTIVAVSTGPRREVSVTIDLYPIFYANKPRVQLRFGGIENFDAVQRYIDKLHYDTEKESKSGDYWFFFQTDWCGPIRIHCSSMSVTELQSPCCEPSHAPEPATGPESNGESSPPAR
jgi:hypothetical protein